MARRLPARFVPSPRIWVLFALLAAIGYVACGAGAVPCHLARPAAIVATVLATVISLFDAPRPPSDLVER
ncbi:MAG: hypothetical protein EPO65_13080 [Dehalococcoidia bacterium]|nr:MAG: hypothetical protein EPO65_13080 [Dehalococcoidia bacterium]